GRALLERERERGRAFALHAPHAAALAVRFARRVREPAREARRQAAAAERREDDGRLRAVLLLRHRVEDLRGERAAVAGDDVDVVVRREERIAALLRELLRVRLGLVVAAAVLDDRGRAIRERADGVDLLPRRRLRDDDRRRDADLRGDERETGAVVAGARGDDARRAARPEAPRRRE